jgi:hypothetical protein
MSALPYSTMRLLSVSGMSPSEGVSHCDFQERPLGARLRPVKPLRWTQVGGASPRPQTALQRLPAGMPDMGLKSEASCADIEVGRAEGRPGRDHDGIRQGPQHYEGPLLRREPADGQRRA